MSEGNRSHLYKWIKKSSCEYCAHFHTKKKSWRKKM